MQELLSSAEAQGQQENHYLDYWAVHYINI